MNDWDFAEFNNKLKEAVEMLDKDKASRVETHIDSKSGKEYKITIEESNTISD